MLHKALQNKWARVLIAVFATFLYALGVNLFVVPMGLYSGGVVGLSQIIRTLLAQAVEEQGVKDFENVRAAGVVHT